MAGEPYAGVYFIKTALGHAGTTVTKKVIKAVKRKPLAWDTLEGWKIMLPEDHSVAEDCLWGQTSYNEKYGFSMPKSFEWDSGAETCRLAEELKQVRVNRRKGKGLWATHSLMGVSCPKQPLSNQPGLFLTLTPLAVYLFRCQVMVYCKIIP